MNLRVVSLQAQNVMRLSAVEIKWDPSQSVMTIGGKNGAGKSSALNAVAMALGGMALCPEEPIRKGEKDGFVELNLGDITVRRDFWREVMKETAPDGAVIERAGNKEVTYGDTKSRLVVRNTEGMKLEPAQTLLDKLIGKLTFDPMAFVFEEPKRQEEILRRIVNLDFTILEEKRKAAYDRRAHYNKLHKESSVLLAKMPKHKDVPAEEVSMKEISDEMGRAEELRRYAEDATRKVLSLQGELTGVEYSYAEVTKFVADLEAKLKEAKARLTNTEEQKVKAATLVESAKVVEAEAKKAIPDVEGIRKRLGEIEETNTKVRANLSYTKAEDELKLLAGKAAFEEGVVQEMVDAKRNALEAAKFPVPGLSLEDGGVTFGGIPFKQASTAEQIRVSVAIGFALNPGLKLLLVRNGNALDEDSMKLVAEEADKAGGQILMEYVTKDAKDVSVMIEDGHVAS